ncbi:MAG: hypothetical protein AAGH78_06745 [Cyanobacteria bacterium P01_H01_bin.58]
MGNNIVTARLTIKGNRTLLTNRFSSAAIPLERRNRSGVAGNNPMEWKQTALLTPKRQFYLPGTYIFSCLREAAIFTTGKQRTQREVAATLQVKESVILIENRFLPEEPFYIEQQEVRVRPEAFIDVAVVRNPKSGARNVRYRAATSPGWQCSFHLMWDQTVIPQPLLESICLDAGALVGLADGRNLGYGRFDVQKFEVIQ